MSRKGVLGVCFVICLVLSSGCFGLQNSEPSQTVTEQPTNTEDVEATEMVSQRDTESATNSSNRITHDIVLQNFYNQSRVVAVLVTSGDKVVAYDLREVDPGAEWRVSTIRTAGEYTVTVKAPDGRSVERSYELPMVDGNRTSYANIHIRENAQIDIDVFWQV